MDNHLIHEKVRQFKRLVKLQQYRKLYVEPQQEPKKADKPLIREIKKAFSHAKFLQNTILKILPEAYQKQKDIYNKDIYDVRYEQREFSNNIPEKIVDHLESLRKVIPEWLRSPSANYANKIIELFDRFLKVYLKEIEDYKENFDVLLIYEFIIRHWILVLEEYKHFLRKEFEYQDYK
jgi:hypothetical protein